MIYNLGSINADYFYQVPHLPQPGETIAATALSMGLGGKGANMSVAVARAGGNVVHIGAVGPDGAWAVARMAAYGVDVSHVAAVQDPTGHAIINVDTDGENAIVVFPGANSEQEKDRIEAALDSGTHADTLLLQIETNGQQHALRCAKEKGMRVIYAAAPYNYSAVLSALPHTDVLVLNEIEMRQLQVSTGHALPKLGVRAIVVTRGARGARVYSESDSWIAKDFASPIVKAVDTTGAGDTFAGFLTAGLTQQMSLDEAVERAVAAAALKVTRKGTADAIPSLKEVLDFMG